MAPQTVLMKMDYLECTVEQCCYAGIQAVNQSNVDIYGGLDGGGGVPKSVFNKKSSCLFVIR